MNEQELQQHLSHISTMWTMLHQAHRGSADEAALARRVLMERYCGAVYRYLLSAVRDRNVADDLTQEFALRFIQSTYIFKSNKKKPGSSSKYRHLRSTGQRSSHARAKLPSFAFPCLRWWKV